MAKTGARAESLAESLSAAGLQRVSPPAVPRPGGLPRDRVEALQHLYVLLGGDPARFDQLRPGGWDLAVADGLLVELDEQQHFNRHCLARLSVHDEIDGRSLEAVLRTRDLSLAPEVLAFVTGRVSDGDIVEFRFNV